MTTQTLKSILMPVAMVIGALLCRPLATLEAWTGGVLTPTLIAAMLFITFCKVDIRAMRLSTIHIWMLAVQFLGSIAVYHIMEPLFGEIIAEGALICVLAPIAMAAVVIHTSLYTASGNVEINLLSLRSEVLLLLAR